MMSSLATLPTEVLFWIMGHLPYQRDRLNLAKCNAHMYVGLHAEAFRNMEFEPCCCAPQRVEKLGSLLLRNAYLEGKVKSLKVGRMRKCDQYHAIQVPARRFNPVLTRLIKGFGQSSTLELKKWFRHFQATDNTRAWSALIICLLPNMTYLEWFSEEWATVYNEGSPTFPYMTPARALQSVQKGFYKAPKYTAFELISMTPGWHIAQLKSIFASASMRRITIDGMPGTYPDLAPRNSSPITHIEVHGISRSGFKELITHCVNLKSFTYFYYGEIFSHFSMKSYIDAISSKKHSLETLCISQAPVNCPIIDSEAFNITFNGFSALKNLELPMHTFLQFVDVNYPLDHSTPDRVSACLLMPLARNLPPSLERLCVTQWTLQEDYQYMIYQLVNLVRSKSICFLTSAILESKAITLNTCSSSV